MLVNAASTDAPGAVSSLLDDAVPGAAPRQRLMARLSARGCRLSG
ncbi:MAG: hypothetical protein AVDCRST_MAG53-1478 [uncultured Solirubrobacteraceae bacterium]|uniref:Uncharacterized protein n=1 Tax=uncultured Solirubrobacteraceae bacterium TaxID=1162706 RepID=A0A6J4SGW1_9ACTN|nr:MAG: hypothetical protein AVDCRST_MAG53-1478 [uncultured Solirubrobacteraceae bacterium]